MASFKTLEIDTLRLRNLLIATKDNSLIPADFQIYSKGDGTTFWSTGVTAIQFINLSTNVLAFQRSNAAEHKEMVSTYANNQRLLQTELFSTLFGFSTFSQNLSTYEVSLLYTDSKLANYSTQLTSYLGQTYQTLAEASIQSTQTQQALVSTKQYIDTNISSLNSTVQTVRNSITANSTAQSQVNLTLSSFTNSTVNAIYAIEDLNKATLQTSIINNATYLQNNINNLSTNVGNTFKLNNVEAFDTKLQTAISTLSSNMIVLTNNIYVSSTKYTDAQISSLSSFFSQELVQTSTTISQLINQNSTAISNQLTLTNGNITSTISTNLGIQTGINTTLTNDLNLLLTTGLTTQIYKTFTELESYSAGIVESTVVSANIQFISTIQNFTIIYAAALQAANINSFNYLVNTAYLSSLSTLLPQITTTLTATIDSDIADFNTQINTLEQQFQEEIAALNKLNTDTVNQQIITNNALIEAQLADVQNRIEFGIQIAVENLKLGETSTFFQTQFQTAPSIIMNSVDNLITLRNVQNITGLQSLTAQQINLDLSTYDNFYLYVSDIKSDIFYGLTYTPPQEVLTKDINLFIDITSSYTNDFLTIDTSCLSNWLQKPKIYNQGPYGLYEKNVPQIYLSTFLGAHIVQMRLSQNILYIKDIITIPYIYTVMTLSQIDIQTNVTVNNPALQNSTFLYSNSTIPISWQTNDLNVAVGIKFEGTDLCGNQVTSWSGPYSSATNTALINVPAGKTLVQYNKIYLSIYPPNGYESAPASGNISGTSQVFDTLTLTNPILVYSPTINCRISIYNPGSLQKILEVSELEIYNTSGQNIVGRDSNNYVNIVSTSSYPYQGDFSAWRLDNIFDGAKTTSFRAGQDAQLVDTGAYITCDIKSINPTISQTLSSIVVYGSENNDSLFSIDGFNLKIENKNQPGIQDGLFSKIVALNGFTPNVVGP